MGPQPPKISVALCTFNGAKYLAEQLQSLAGQDYKIDELIVSDDVSTDDTEKIIRDFSAGSPMPVRFSLNPSQLGISRNFQRAIEHCTGDIIFLCDQDDRWRPNKVRTILQCFADEKVGLAFSNAEIVGPDGSATGRKFWESIGFSAAEQNRVRAGDAVPVLLRHAVAAGSMLAFRSRYLPLILPLSDLPRSHDIWITLLIAAVAKIYPIDEALIDYRLHPSNQIGAPPPGVGGQIEMARRQIRQNAFGLAAELHEAIFQRLTTKRSDWPVTDQTLKLLREKIDHCRARHLLPVWPKRLATMAREIQRGNYRKYSYGFKSVLQDLFLR